MARSTQSTPEPDHSHESGRLWLADASAPAPELTERLHRAEQRCTTLQAEVADAQARLALLRQELDGTRAGERRAQHLAHHDSLTGLPNPRLFMARLAQRLSDWPNDTSVPDADRLAPCVVFLDLDGFKRVNDSYGHAAGDALLKAVAQRLSATVRTGDLVARMGGDEFACLLDGPLPDEQLARLAHKLFAALAASITLPLPGLGKVTLQVMPSIGLARCPQDGADPTALLAAADAAMYRAKRTHTQVAFASGPQV